MERAKKNWKIGVAWSLNGCSCYKVIARPQLPPDYYQEMSRVDGKRLVLHAGSQTWRLEDVSVTEQALVARDRYARLRMRVVHGKR